MPQWAQNYVYIYKCIGIANDCGMSHIFAKDLSHSFVLATARQSQRYIKCILLCLNDASIGHQTRNILPNEISN